MKRLIVFLLAAGQWALLGDSTVVFNEVMYHPQTNEPAMEWVELYNQMAVDVDISNWTLEGDIYFKFAPGTVVKGRGFLVVSISPTNLNIPNVVGPFTNRLSNNGGTLELRNNNRRLMDRLKYGVGGDWPVGPDGSGFSLAKLDRNSASELAANWTVSEQRGGTPGQDNFPWYKSQVVNRLLDNTQRWRAELSGTDLGTEWSLPAYPDNGWASGNQISNGSFRDTETRTITTLFHTGLDASRNVIAPGNPDPHYKLIVAAQGPTDVQAPVIQNHPAWLANDGESSWIGPTNPGTINVNFGRYDYQTTFDLTGFDPNSVQLTARISVDNTCSNVLLNGTPLGWSYSGFTAYSPPFTATNGFVAGTNTLVFQTVNEGTSANPAGFRALLSGISSVILTNLPLSPSVTTYYFRTTFVFTNDPGLTQLILRPQVVDGAVFYLNGVEAARVNMPAGPVTASTPALTNATPPGYVDSIILPAQSLVAGTNVLAVEVHRAAGNTSTNTALGLELVAQPIPPEVPALVFNETAPATNGPFWLEIMNRGSNSASLEGCVIYRDGTTNQRYTFPTGVTLEPGALLAVDEAALGFRPLAGDRLYLLSPGEAHLLDAVELKRSLKGRRPDGWGPWLFPSQPTPGQSNLFIINQDVVINEIMYRPRLVFPTNGAEPFVPPGQYIELYNRGTNVVDLTGWVIDGGVRFSFPAGQTIAPGGYLVIAQDADYLSSNYPAANIIGNFSGKLSGGGELLILKDPNGNPANQVRYYDSGRWPEYADGGGSSLELMDPWADNSKGEAWAASDESGKSTWQTYSYRGVTTNMSFYPTQWNDFVFNLLSDGECLIDDISVIENPDGAAIQCIANGNFENGTTGWRLLGNHSHSRVEIDPENPGNHVLHLVATGPGEHMHNHVETTFSGGRTIAANQTYLISFRAKWLAGDNQLNTRLYFNRAFRTTRLPAPVLGGTPGGRNSRYSPNAGPTFDNLQHSPVTPAPTESVRVSISVADPQEVSACQLWYSVNSGAWSSVPMTPQPLAGEPFRYVGSVPPQPAGAVVQFYVRAVDGLGAASTYPKDGADSGALYVVQDGQARTDLGHNFRIIMTPANTALMHAPTNVMSNDRLPCTVVLNENRPYYDARIRLKASERGRNASARVSYHIKFPAEDPFMGVHPYMLLDRSGGRRYGRAFGQDEIVVKHIANRAGGIVSPYMDICWIIPPRTTETGPCLLYPRYEDVYIATQFPNGQDGNLWEYELTYYPTTADANGYKLPEPDNVLGFDLQDLGGEKEIYRYNFIIKMHRDRDDYAPLMNFCKMFSQTNNTVLQKQAAAIMDLDWSFRGYALISLCGVADIYSFGNYHNIWFYYRPGDQKFVLVPQDTDFSFYQTNTYALIGTASGPNFSKILNLPVYQRMYYGHIMDILNSAYNSAYMSNWTAHYTKFCPGQNFNDLPAYIDARASYARSVISGAGGLGSFTVSSPSSFSTGSNVVMLSGSAPVTVRTIKINGIEYPITWNSLVAWSIPPITLGAGTNMVQIQGYDLNGQLVSGASVNLTINYTNAAPPPEGTVCFSEIMYHPVVPGAEFVEIYNASTNFTYDLSGWRINGLGYVFTNGSLLYPRQYIVLVKDPAAYQAAYGASAPYFDVYGGNLQSDGETLTLLRPPPAGSGMTNEIVVDRVRYEPNPPWPASAAGGGTSLQLLDPTRDNSRVANWQEMAGWRFASFTGTNSGSVTPGILMLLPQGPGDVYIDDLSVVEGTNAGVGFNVITNGDFEAPLEGTWYVGSNLINSMIVTNVKHSGNSCLLMRAASLGTSYPTSINQTNQFLATTNAIFTLSFWYLPASLSNVVIRTRSSTFAPKFNVAPAAPYTPGAPPTIATTLPELPPVWLNEVQPENTTGVVDNFGEHDPWVEIYNSGTNEVSLNGWYLTDSYQQLARWPFPDGTTIAPGQFLLVWADGQPEQTTGGNLHANFRLSPTNGSVALVMPISGNPTVLDYLNYANTPAGYSYGDAPDGQPFYRGNFYYATPAATNNPASAPLNVFINEWMASNTRTLLPPGSTNYEDWFELYNAGDTPANLEGYYLTDNLSNPFQFRIPAGFIIPPRSWLLVWADNKGYLNTNNPPQLHVDFQLNRTGEAIGLFGADGTVIDAVIFGEQTSDVSQGRDPDGSTNIVFLATPTPGQANRAGQSLAGPPVLAPIADTNVVEGTMLVVTAVATDTNQPPVPFSYNLLPDAPAGVAIDANTGVITWTPTEAQGPGSYTITVLAAQTASPFLSATRTFTVTVLETNQAPQLTIIPDMMVDEGVELSFTASASDADLPPNSLTFSLDEFAPAGAWITADGHFHWTPSEAQGPGDYPVNIIVTDNGSPSLSATQTFMITVNEVNQAPTIQSPGQFQLLLGQTLNFNASAADSDLPTQTLSFSLDENAPTGASITSEGLFSWRPATNQAPGTNIITITVTDNGTPPLSASADFTVVVGKPPKFDVSGTKIVLTNNQIRFEIEALPGKTYRLDYADSLPPVTWQPAGPAVQATNSTVILTAPTAGSSRKFYRISAE